MKTWKGRYRFSIIVAPHPNIFSAALRSGGGISILISTVCWYPNHVCWDMESWVKDSMTVGFLPQLCTVHYNIRLLNIHDKRNWEKITRKKGDNWERKRISSKRFPDWKKHWSVILYINCGNLCLSNPTIILTIYVALVLLLSYVFSPEQLSCNYK